MTRSSSKNSKAEPASPEIKQMRERLRASFPAKEEGAGARADEARPATPPMAAASDTPPDTTIDANLTSSDVQAPEKAAPGR